MFAPRCHLSMHHTIFMIVHQTSILKCDNTVALLRGLSSTVFKIYDALAASTSSTALAKIACHLPRSFCPNFNTTFCLFPTLLFALSRFGFHRTFMFHRDAFFQIHHESLVLSNRFLVFKMGGKSFGTSR